MVAAYEKFIQRRVKERGYLDLYLVLEKKRDLRDAYHEHGSMIS